MYYWIIETNLDLQQLYKQFLTFQGHEVDCFSSAKEALQSLSEKRPKPDICVIDYPLLGQNEPHLSELLHKLDSSSKIIFSISDLGDWNELRDIDSLILEKPFRLKNLLPTSNRFVNQY
ncbi:MAG: hypothetical protein ACFFDI_23515 [Promethearchaeota archaeon]